MSTALPLVRLRPREQSRRCRAAEPRTDEETTMRTLPTTTSHDLLEALDGLAAAAARTGDDACGRAVLSLVVQHLEDAAGGGLGSTDGDPLVVLQRRFGRAHARLATRPAADVDGDLLLGLASALQPEPAGHRRHSAPAVSAAVLVGC
jgi:hypothetical protein